MLLLIAIQEPNAVAKTFPFLSFIVFISQKCSKIIAAVVSCAVFYYVANEQNIPVSVYISSQVLNLNSTILFRVPAVAFHLYLDAALNVVAIIYDHIVKIKQEVEAELYGEDANITGEACLEGRERIRYTRGQLLQLKDDILKLKQEVEAGLFGEEPNQDHADNNSEASCFGGCDRVSYTRDQLLQLREVVNISDHIIKIKQDVESELFGEDASRDHAETDIGGSRVEGRESFRYTLDQMLKLREVANISDNVLKIKEVAPLLFHDDANVPAQSQARYLPLQFPTTQQQYTRWGLDRGTISKFLMSKFLTLFVNQEGLIKPKRRRSTARRRNRSGKYHVLKTAKGQCLHWQEIWACTSSLMSSIFKSFLTLTTLVWIILNKLTPENFGIFKGRLLDAGITRADILKGVISLIFDKAALEPTFCPMNAQLCFYLNEKLPPFPSTDEPGGEEITFEHVLLNTCDEAYEGVEKLLEELMQMTAPEQALERMDKEELVKSRDHGNKMLTGQLLRRKMIPKMTYLRHLLQFVP
ncbi:hypothetical protein P3S68_032678 [Capsicum galapagoense]